MKEILLTRGHVAVIDDEDYELLSEYRWVTLEPRPGIFYAVTYFKRADGKWRSRYMHRILCPGGQVVDHIDHNGLNNTRKNLRAATYSQNLGNMYVLLPNKASRYKGVGRDGGRWKGRIRVSGKLIHLGLYDDEIDAAKAYDVAAHKYFGEFARTNEMLGLYS